MLNAQDVTSECAVTIRPQRKTAGNEAPSVERVARSLWEGLYLEQAHPNRTNAH